MGSPDLRRSPLAEKIGPPPKMKPAGAIEVSAGRIPGPFLGLAQKPPGMLGIEGPLASHRRGLATEMLRLGPRPARRPGKYRAVRL